MGVCLSVLPRHAGRDELVKPQLPCELHRLPSQVLASILSLLDQKELFGTIPLVCKAWRAVSHDASQGLQLDLSNPARHLQMPQLLLFLQQHGQQLQYLQVNTSKPLGVMCRRSLLRCLGGMQCYDSKSSSRLQLQQLALQLDLDTYDLAFLTRYIIKRSPTLHTLKLQPVKPTLADLQLLVLACILGNLVGAEAAGPALPHLAECYHAVQQLATTATQLRSLSLSRYEIGNTACLSAASQLTALALQHCGLTNTCLAGLASLKQVQRLELSDNYLTAASLEQLSHMGSCLTHLDISVMPSISRMRSSSTTDLGVISKLTSLQELNIIGFGVSNATALSALVQLSWLGAGLNPLNAQSLRTIGQLPQLQHLELGGISQAWVLSSVLPPPEALRAHDACWYGLQGLDECTHLDLGGSNFSHSVWTCHICPVLGGMRQLRRLQLAHCHIPAGSLLQLLPALTDKLEALSIDRCTCTNEDLVGLLQLTKLTKLSCVALLPRLGNKQATVLSQLVSLRCLSVRNNDLGSKGVQALIKGLTQLTCLDISENQRVGKRFQKQLGHLRGNAEAAAEAEAQGGYW